MKETPFKDIYIHPLIRDEKGQKMSKSKGNIIDPLDLLEKYGADTLRFTLTALLNPGRDVKLSESRVKGYKSFSNKIWNAANFLKLNNCFFKEEIDLDQIQLHTNKWIINELIFTFSKIESNINKYLFHEVANLIYHFVWHTFCDWYIELIKSNIDDKNKSNEIKLVSGWLFGQILKMIHPIMPFLSEKLWQNLFNKDKFLMLQKIQSFKSIENFNYSKNNIDKIINLITSVRNVRSELEIPYKKSIDLYIEIKDNDFRDFIDMYIKEIKNLLKVNIIVFDNLKNRKGAFIVLNDISIFIPLDGIVDTNKELLKLNRRKDIFIEKLDKIESKLKNHNFIDKAPKNIIDDFKIQLNEFKSSIEKIDQIINTIK